MNVDLGFDPRTLGKHMPRKRFQKGTLKMLKQKSGNVYEGSWYVYVWKKGREVRRRRTKVLGLSSSMSKNEAVAKLLQEIAKSTGQQSNDGNLTLDSAKKRYTDTRVGTWSDNHQATFESVWATHISPAWGKIRLDNLDRQRLQEWLNSIAEDFSKSMVRHIKTNLTAVVELAFADQLCRSNQAKRLIFPKTKPVKRGFLTIEQARTLILAAEKQRDRLVMRLFFQVGLRPQELAVLRGNDLDVKGNRLRIDEALGLKGIKCTKTEASDGWVPLTESLTKELAAHIKAKQVTDEAWLFHGRWPRMPFGTDDWLRSVLQPLAKKVGIPHVTLQMARRTTGTHANKHAGPKAAQGMLRHSTLDVTMNVYVGQIPEEVRKAAQMIEDELNLEGRENSSDSERVIETERKN